jgi:DNA-binding XRE family transcriptional regulator
VSRQTIDAIENGIYDPSLPLAFTIARLFKKASKMSSLRSAQKDAK